MTEQQLPGIHCEDPGIPKSSSTLIQEISSANRSISQIKYMQGAFVFAPYETDRLITERKNLHGQVNSKLFDLITLRNAGLSQEIIDIEITNYPGEKPHPFSANFVKISVPSPQQINSTYQIHARLLDFRGTKVSDSIQAEQFLGEKIVIPDDSPIQYLSRTKDELLLIKNERYKTLENYDSSNYSVSFLNKLIKYLAIERLIPLKKLLEDPNLRNPIMFGRRNDKHGTIYEEIAIRLKNVDFSFSLPNGTLKKALNENFDGYDYSLLR